MKWWIDKITCIPNFWDLVFKNEKKKIVLHKIYQDEVHYSVFFISVYYDLDRQ